jgi:putative acetyltransferase
MSIRVEKPTDIEKIWRINAEAFETEEEANLVNVLRNSDLSYISLIYEENHELVGHIFFTPVELVGNNSGLRVIGLAPMAVIPEMQNKGIGSLLVKAGIQQCISEGYDAIVVLGHPNYYPKFGFVPSVKYGIKSEYEVPEDVFMILELKENTLQGRQGTVKYHEAFSSV